MLEGEDAPMPVKPRPDRPDDGRQTVLERAPKLAKPPMYKAILHNDDYTTMDFVVMVLREVFHQSESEATHLMLTIHHKGSGVAGVFTRDVAESKVAQTQELATAHGMPLMCTTEPEP
jgi:ATP-dependent Clp protease adaptor protein ClpS